MMATMPVRVLLAVLAVLPLLKPASAETATREQMLAAAATVRAAQALMLERKLALGLWPGEKIDPNRTGLVGQEFTAMTTTAATLANKRAATNPDFAAALARRMAELGVGKGKKVLIIQSGSFLGADIAVLAAAEALEAEVILIPSLGSSQWGANDPELNLMEVLALLLDNGVLHTKPLAVVLGGASGLGRNMQPGAPDILRASVKAHGQLLVDDTPLKAMVDHLSALIDKASGGRDRLALMVKVGGSIISVGNCPENLKFETDIRPQGTPCSGSTPGLLYRAGTEHVPILHLLNMKLLSETLGFDYDPVPLPEPGSKVSLYGAP
jgi:poly-gamma-glutamate system protein